MRDMHGKNNPNWKGGNVAKTCLICRRKFLETPLIIKMGRGKYCSKECAYIGQKTGKMIDCIVCGKNFYIWKEYPNRKFCCRNCYLRYCKENKGEKHPLFGKEKSKETKIKMHENHANYKGSNHPQWKGGRIVRQGYIALWKPDHPHRKCGGYVLEHRLVMEEFLGRYLDPKEIVHHKDHNVQNNKIENLELLTNGSEHAKKHNFGRKRDKKTGIFL